MGDALFSQSEYVILDLETTGLIPETDAIIQIAWMLLDTQMRPLGLPHSFGSVFVDTDKPVMEWGAKEMHLRTGLLERYLTIKGRGACLHPTVVESVLSSVFRKGISLVGNQVEAFDNAFLRKHMPAVSERFAHTFVNVSSLRDVRANTLGVSRNVAKSGFGYTHDAWGDVVACFHELHFFRGLFAKG